MIASLNQIVPRLKKLLLMLSSERDGEIVNAARLINTTLRGVGADWHDLVAGLLTSARTATQSAPNDRELNWPRELEFVTGLGNWRGQLTERQSAWLNAIHARVRRAAA